MMRYSVAIREEENDVLLNHLIREDGQEDLCFAIYNISTGKERVTGIITSIILPEEGDRNIHGNVSFNNQYFDRISNISLEKNQGICFIHSHPTKGWQGMSQDDIVAEKLLSPRVKTITKLPLIGMTVGSDGFWSSRFWIKTAPKTYERYWCENTRVVGRSLQIYNKESFSLNNDFKNVFERTISSWGDSKQSIISNMTVGVVGLGSVGSVIVEALQKTGVQNIRLIDFDNVEVKNLDRLQGVNQNDVKKSKVKVFQKLLNKNSISTGFIAKAIPYSIAEEEGLKNALDCDVLFSCVDRPWPRYILDQLSYSNYIPVIDGGIECSINKSLTNLDYARWKSHTVGVGRACMECLGQYSIEDVSTEMNGDFERETYIKGLPKEHFINRGENVFGFSLGLAGMEFQQFLSLIIFPRKINHGPKEYDFNTGNIDNDFIEKCKPNCNCKSTIGFGDKTNTNLISDHEIAVKRRLESAKEIPAKKSWWSNFIKRFK